ncbi:MAG: 50S ribosomal protein L25/general stress protein Ctc [Xanthomonadales bacterium]|nr:50S ribosomal protein L25/general stress protein Ctc [Xanthomonadales bacterium]
MAKTHELSVALRKDEGKGASRRLRRAGSVPAIVYGGGELGPVSIQMAHNDVYLASQNEWFYSSILDLSLNGDVQKVLLRDMQRHPFKQQILHLDFLRINENEAIRVRVPLHFLNQETSPAGKTAGVVIMHEITEVEVSCLPKDLPEFIEVDLADLKVDDILHLSSLKLPKGTEVAELKLGKEHDIAVVIAKLGRAEVEPTEAGEGTEEKKEGEGDK